MNLPKIDETEHGVWWIFQAVHRYPRLMREQAVALAFEAVML